METNVIDLPEPEESGSSGDQVAAKKNELAIPSQNPVAGQPIEQTFNGLASSKYRSMGGGIGASLIAGSMSQIVYELSEVRSELRILRRELDNAKLEIQSEKVKNAVLMGKLESAENEKQIRNILLMSGTAIFSLGVEQVIRDQRTGWLFIVIGILLNVVGWFSLGKKEAK